MSQTSSIPNTDSQPSSSSLSQGTHFKCPVCTGLPRYFETKHGLNIHIARMHRKHFPIQSSAPSPVNAVGGGDSAGPNLSPSKPFWQQLGELKNSVPVIKRIPRGARLCVASALKSNIDRVVSSNCRESWEDLLTFSYRILHIRGDWGWL